ncbi:MAG: hypothetical protein HYU66_04725 [Armatimonadetes bacterium]|nr:hypothetical protein [Armatimonadota bacterium]
MGRLLRLDDEACREIASRPAALAYGVLFAAIAGLARNYDRADFAAGGWAWKGPLLSLAVGCGTALVFALSAWLWGARNVPLRGMVAVFLMTSPLAWLYALPNELVFGADGAQIPNFLTLAVVTGWRIAICLEAYKVLLGFGRVKQLLAFFVPIGCWVGLLLGGFTMMASIMEAMMAYGVERDTSSQADLGLAATFAVEILFPIIAGVRWRRWLKDTVAGPLEEPPPDAAAAATNATPDPAAPR